MSPVNGSLIALFEGMRLDKNFVHPKTYESTTPFYAQISERQKKCLYWKLWRKAFLSNIYFFAVSDNHGWGMAWWWYNINCLLSLLPLMNSQSFFDQCIGELFLTASNLAHRSRKKRASKQICEKKQHGTTPFTTATAHIVPVCLTSSTITKREYAVARGSINKQQGPLNHVKNKHTLN